ncbi:trypsin-4-like [Culicoides brevitarsis]|uniref:trypsin-4-like n=1 Tax=Culicoides brevitarsis TaxID=469753 RepID=UPI00307C40C8
MKFLIFCVAFWCGATLALPQSELIRRPVSDHRIVGGFQTAIQTFPYQVSLMRSGTHICGGSIISSKWVLTAAHCTNGYTANYFAVRVGSSNKMIGGAIVGIKTIIQHENFNRFTIDFDYALLELEHTLPRTKKIQSIALPKQGANLPDNVKLLVSGWGDTRSNTESKVILRAATVLHINHDICNGAYAEFGGITDQMICAGYLAQGGRDSCQGDSGGPLAGNGTLYGVVSWGYDCASPGYPGVYAKVSAIRTWIGAKTGI